MQAESLRELGLWWLFYTSRPWRLLWNTPSKFAGKPAGKAVGGISEQSKAERQRAALGTEVAFFLLSKSEFMQRGWAPHGRWSLIVPASMDEKVFLIGRGIQQCENLGVLPLLDSLAGAATG